MEKVYRLCRKSQGSGGLKWHYVNRLVDEEGRTLFAGATPNGYFKKAVLFKDADGRDAFSFGADRRVAPSAFVSKDASGDELFRIKLPVAARLRTSPVYPMTAAQAGETMEIIPARSVADNEVNRLVSCFMQEFVVRRDNETVAYSGALPIENSSEDFAKQVVSGVAKSVLSDLRKIPGNLLKLGSGARKEFPAGQVTVADPTLGARFALTLLLFRTYIFKDIESPEERWWQAG